MRNLQIRIKRCVFAYMHIIRNILEKLTLHSERVCEMKTRTELHTLIPLREYSLPSGKKTEMFPYLILEPVLALQVESVMDIRLVAFVIAAKENNLE